MSEQSWKPLFRRPRSTVTTVLHSEHFMQSRMRAGTTIDDAAALRSLAYVVEQLDHVSPPLSTIADRVEGAVRFVRARADRLETDGAVLAATDQDAPASTGAGVAARERLLVAALDYLVTPVDLVPDFRPGGYVDDVLLLTWVFGAAAAELEPYLDDPPRP